MKQLLLVSFFVSMVAIFLTACGQSPDSDDNKSTTGDSSELLDDHTDTAQLSIDINLPSLPADADVLADTLRQVSDHAKREFPKMLPDPKEFPEYADRQFSMELNFRVVAESQRFISVQESGYQDAGGAHPIPVSATYVFDRKAGEMIPLAALFDNTDAALKALSAYAREKLTLSLLKQTPADDQMTPEIKQEWQQMTRQMLEQGTEPTLANFGNYTIQKGENPLATSPGIRLVFSPYQVAAYVYGTQTVDVPAKVFATFLKADYQPAFADQ